MITEQQVETALITWFRNEISWDKGMAPWTADQFRVEMRATLEAALQSAAETPAPAAWLCVHKISGKRELRFEAIEDLPFNRERWDWYPLLSTEDYSKPASNYNPGGNLIGGESPAAETPAPQPNVLGLEALLDDVWNAAVEQAAVIARDCVHLTPEPDAAIRVMLNRRAKLHPSSRGALATEGQP